jgi:dUTP pyrophosphatase
MIKIPFKKFHKDAQIPKRAHKPDAGFDLTCTSIKDTDKYIQYGTGIGMHIPVGYVGLIFPRSSITKKDLMLKNSVGVIDSGYLGEISFRFWKLNHNKQVYKVDVNSIPDGITPDEFMDYYNKSGIEMKDAPEVSTLYEQYDIGDRIGQIIIFKLPDVSFEEVDELEDSERGEGSYGSTDNK